jgi:glyoxylase-like metal-dependent hydrolase (beta-lactamase superfamily II)
MPGKFKKVFDGVYLVGNGGWGGTEAVSKPGDGNVYLVDGGGELALVDSGVGPQCHDIIENVKAAGFAPEKITSIFLTHAHGDHSGGAAWLAGVTGARLCAGEVTARALAAGDRCLVGGLGPFSGRTVAPLPVERWLRDGDEVSVGAVRIKALYTPGHTIDSCSFLADVGGRSVLFSGDTVVGNQPRADFGGRVFKGMLGWLDGHWSAPITTYVATLERLLALEPDVMLPGHGIPNDRATAADAIRAGIKNLKRILDDPDLFIMFAIER